jgi:hypothetical protein
MPWAVRACGFRLKAEARTLRWRGAKAQVQSDVERFVRVVGWAQLLNA